MMFDLELQRRIREKKTPLALTLAPEAEKLNGKFVKNFIDMFGDTPMAQAEALRYHGTTLLDAAAGCSLTGATSRTRAFFAWKK